jgi:threonine/homoserine/homoserine lactone efflux protein
MSENLFFPLAMAAVTVASLHTLAPDHWMPIAALARTQGWTAGRTTRITLACGLGHVTTSVALGLLAVFFGVEVFSTFGTRLESVAGLLLIAFGIGYGVWGLKHAASHLHGHHHPHYDHVHEPQQATPWTLFLVYAADPCVAILPLMVAAAPLGWMSLVGLAVIYEVATITTMVSLVLPARSAANTVVRGQWVHRYGDAVAGAFIALVGVTVAILGW